MWPSFFAAFIAAFPSRLVPGYFFDKETQFWQFEAMWFVTFLALYMLVLYVIQRFVKPAVKSR